MEMEFDFFSALQTLNTSLNFEHEGDRLALYCINFQEGLNMSLEIFQSDNDPETFDIIVRSISRFSRWSEVIASGVSDLQEAVLACECYFQEHHLIEDNR